METSSTIELGNAAFQLRVSLGREVQVTLLDNPSVAPVGRSLRQRLEWPLRVILALIAGVGLLFLLDYLDTSVRRSEELEAMGLPVVGTIPRG